MPAVDGTLTPEDVSDELGIPVDERMTVVTDAARQWAQNLRSLTAPATLWSEPDAHHGGVLYAALLYQRRAQPQGLPGFDEFSGLDTGMAIYTARELVGTDPVTA